jgi:glycosyltransferase involved in cell wall biosynthesis
VVASVQNLSGAHAVRKYGWGLRGWLPRLLERPLLRRFPNVVTVSQGIAGEMQSWWRPGPGGRLAVIPNSVSPAFAAIAGTPAPPEEPAILFLGRIDPYQKGLDTLLRAYALAAPRMPGIRLELAGAGTPAAVQQVRAWAAEQHLPVLDCAAGSIPAGATAGPLVVWRGKLDGADAVAAMRRCLFLAMPSRYEAWPITALEAAVCGRPVLGADVTGVRDAAPATAHGRLVPAADPAAFAEAMVELAGDAELRRSLGERGRAWAAAFTWDRLAAQQERFYQEVLAATAPSPAGTREDRDTGPA